MNHINEVAERNKSVVANIKHSLDELEFKINTELIGENGELRSRDNNNRGSGSGSGSKLIESLEKVKPLWDLFLSDLTFGKTFIISYIKK
jgi:hypothetical protein